MANTWRRWNAVVHRDLGYLCAGLTIVYAVSGVAVNHRADWNPSYATRTDAVSLSGVDLSAPTSDAFIGAVLARVGLEGHVRGTFRPDPSTMQVFLEGATVTVDLARAEATVEMVRERALLRQANFLHLNEGKKLWTWMADAYAVALLLLAVTGLFVLRGKNGITGRGAWLTAAGVAIPVVFLLLYL